MKLERALEYAGEFLTLPEMNAAREELAALRKDAERYRGLRRVIRDRNKSDELKFVRQMDLLITQDNDEQIDAVVDFTIASRQA